MNRICRAGNLRCNLESASTNVTGRSDYLQASAAAAYRKHSGLHQVINKEHLTHLSLPHVQPLPIIPPHLFSSPGHPQRQINVQVPTSGSNSRVTCVMTPVQNGAMRRTGRCPGHFDPGPPRVYLLRMPTHGDHYSPSPRL